jgi:AcrR family transcriptional regulator
VLVILATALDSVHNAPMPTASAPTTARARARAEITDEIKREARRQLAEEGSDLSLRAVARALGMASSAVYRYFASRDELLTALIVDAYDAVGEAAEQAVARANASVVPQWLALANAIRAWAHSHPHDYALVYGSPVPGYRAPEATIAPASRVGLVALRIVGDGVRTGEIAAGADVALPAPVRQDFAGIAEDTGLTVPDEVLTRALVAWTSLFGTVSFELFGHLHNVIHDFDAFFGSQMQRAVQFVISGDDRSR